MRLIKAWQYGLVMVALAYAAAMCVVIAKNLYYPLELNYVGENVMAAVERAAKGLPIYTAPTLQYIPNLYNPLFFHVAGLFTFIMGMDFLAARIVSILSLIVIAYVLYSWLSREKIDRAAIFCGIGLFAAAGELYEIWHHLTRSDALAAACLMASLYSLLYVPDKAGAVAGGVLGALAFFAKQSMPIALIPLLAVLLFAQRERCLYFGISMAMACLLPMAWLEYRSDGWYSYFAFIMPSSHAVAAHQVWGYWQQLWHITWPALALSALGLYAQYRAQGISSSLRMAAVFMGFIACSYTMMTHSGGVKNSLLLTYLALALLAPFAFRLTPWPAKILVLALWSAQFYLLFYDPRAYIPTTRQYEAAEEYLNKLRQIEGDVLFLRGGTFYPGRDTDHNYSLSTALWDIQRSDNEPLKQHMTAQLREAIAQKKFTAILSLREDVRKSTEAGMPDYHISQYYQLQGNLLSHGMPMTKNRGRHVIVGPSAFMYTPKP